MNNFLKSDIIQTELKEINELQKDISENTMYFEFMNNKNKMEYIEKLELLIDKERVMYARLSLSDDPDAIAMKNNVCMAMSLLGYSSEVNMQNLFDNMQKTIKLLKEQLDS